MQYHRNHLKTVRFKARQYTATAAIHAQSLRVNNRQTQMQKMSEQEHQPATIRTEKIRHRYQHHHRALLQQKT